MALLVHAVDKAGIGKAGIEFLDGRLILVAVQTLQIIPGSSAVFRRGSSASADAQRKSPVPDEREEPLKSNVQCPMGRAVVFITKSLAATQTETGKWHPPSIFLEDDAARTANPIGRANE